MENLKLKDYQNIVNASISRYLNLLENTHQDNKEMIEMIRYCLENDSKKLRSIMIMIFAEIFEIDFSHIENYVIAIEIIHTYTLIHDDLPSLDNDDLRRGKESAHKKFGEANAILLGDTMQTLAFECISNRNLFFSSDQQLNIINTFAKYIGGFEGVIYGEFLDINETKNHNNLLEFFYSSFDHSVNLKKIHKIHLYKTAKLFELCSMICGILTNCEIYNLEYCKNIGIYYGLIFQLLDDYEDFKNSNRREKEINICSILNKNDIKIMYDKYINEIYLNISKLEDQKILNDRNIYNIDKLKKFISLTLKSFD
jgi:geranylgeranyl pyrophosphate synthase